MTHGWTPKLKTYAHFDKLLSLPEIHRLVKSPSRVSANPFFPLLSFNIRSRKFGNPKPKIRSIKYACRRDSYIYSYYRYILSEKYEQEILNRGIQHSVIAYRKIPKDSSLNQKGKSNIEFAKEAFDEIKKRGNCIALAFDIRDFFESIDHANLKKFWENLLKIPRLPDDHFAVYKSITDYKFVEYDECLKRLGLLTLKSKHGKSKKVYAHTKRAMPKQLCSPEEFREKVAGGSLPSLIRRNPHLHPAPHSLKLAEPRGIPQGSPISDLLANLIMLEFDTAMSKYAEENSAYYRRYSDDILIVVGEETDARQVIEKVESELLPNIWMTLNKNKTIISKFSKHGTTLSCKNYSHSASPVSGCFEYLGFSFDGKNIALKNATISKYYKKVTKIVIGHALDTRDKARMLGKKLSEDDINRSLLFHKASRVDRNFNISIALKKGRAKRRPSNFYSYVKRAHFVMKSSHISGQMRRHRKFINDAIRRAVIKLI